MERLVGEKKRNAVLVVGGGVAGSLIAKTLQDHADVYLIDPKEYYEISWTSLRSTVEPSFAERTLINHSEYVPNARVITSAATDITRHEVVTAQGPKVPYDYLVIATGHADAADDETSLASTIAERQAHYQSGIVASCTSGVLAARPNSPNRCYNQTQDKQTHNHSS